MVPGSASDDRNETIARLQQAGRIDEVRVTQQPHEGEVHLSVSVEDRYDEEHTVAYRIEHDDDPENEGGTAEWAWHADGYSSTSERYANLRRITELAAEAAVEHRGFTVTGRSPHLE
jgi:hypothetical protein